MKRKVAAILLWLISLMISRIKRIKTIIKDAMKISCRISWVLLTLNLLKTILFNPSIENQDCRFGTKQKQTCWQSYFIYCVVVEDTNQGGDLNQQRNPASLLFRIRLSI
jgi:hypothetical protein